MCKQKRTGVVNSCGPPGCKKVGKGTKTVEYSGKKDCTLGCAPPVFGKGEKRPRPDKEEKRMSSVKGKKMMSADKGKKIMGSVNGKKRL